MKPKQLWIDDKKTRGYDRADLEDAFERYLPQAPPDKLVKPVGPAPDAAPRPDGRPVEANASTISQKANEPRDDATLPDLPVQVGKAGGDERVCPSCKGGKKPDQAICDTCRALGGRTGA